MARGFFGVLGGDDARPRISVGQFVGTCCFRRNVKTAVANLGSSIAVACVASGIIRTSTLGSTRESRRTFGRNRSLPPMTAAMGTLMRRRSCSLSTRLSTNTTTTRSCPAGTSEHDRQSVLVMAHSEIQRHERAHRIPDDVGFRLAAMP